MSKRYKVNYYNKDHIYYYELINQEYTLVGKAKCHERDYDMENEIVGYTIAYYRAIIKGYKIVIKEIRKELTTLKHFYSVIKQNKHFNSQNYEVKALKRQIKQREESIDFFKEEIQFTQESIQEYIKRKDECYCKIRKIRAKRAKENN